MKIKRYINENVIYEPYMKYERFGENNIWGAGYSLGYANGCGSGEGYGSWFGLACGGLGNMHGIGDGSGINPGSGSFEGSGRGSESDDE